MPLLFNTLLGQVGIAPKDVRLLRHKDRRSDKGKTPYDLWRDDRPKFDYYQESQSIKDRSALKAPYWASFVVTHTGDTLFAGFYRADYKGLNKEERPWANTERINAVGTCDLYKLTLDERLADFTGKLLIDWGKGARTWIQRADNQNKVVLEIRTEFREPEFPGFTDFRKQLSEIEQLPSGWTTALKATRGIYLLTCPKTKEQYVGEATGKDGFYGRWLEYVQNGHGGNVGLKSRDPSDYQVSILEVAGSGDTESDIGEMERRWKQKLQSREMGLNRNL